MVYDSEDIRLTKVVPRCQSCNNHTDFITKNKKTGESRYFCSICGQLEVITYIHDSEWDVIHLT